MVMLWNTSVLPAGNPFVALRRDFERQQGIESSPTFAAMTVVEHSDHWTVDVDVPGLSESEIDVTFNDGSLIIEGERKAKNFEGAKELFNDRSFSKFRRVLKVREAIDRSEIEASLADGVLRLILRRTPEATPTKISIRGAAS